VNEGGTGRRRRGREDSRQIQVNPTKSKLIVRMNFKFSDLKIIKLGMGARRAFAMTVTTHVTGCNG